MAGTCIVKNTEDEPSIGKISVYRVLEKKLQFVAVAEIDVCFAAHCRPSLSSLLSFSHVSQGSPYTLSAFAGKLLAGINSKVRPATLYGLLR